MQKINKVVRIGFAGGLLGVVFGSSRGKVEKVIQAQNADGWNFCESIPDQPNLIIWVFRLILLVLTLGLWTISTGYLFIFEKPAQGNVSKQKSGELSNQPGRLEPTLRAN